MKMLPVLKRNNHNMFQSDQQHAKTNYLHFMIEQLMWKITPNTSLNILGKTNVIIIKSDTRKVL